MIIINYSDKIINLIQNNALQVVRMLKLIFKKMYPFFYNIRELINELQVFHEIKNGTCKQHY